MESNEQNERSYADRLLCLVLDVGEGMLKSGAEIHRVEESIDMICKAYGATHVESFAITSMIVASIRLPDGEYSLQMRRIHSSSNQLNRLAEFNSISRKICKNTPSLDEFEKMIEDAKKSTKYPAALYILGGMLVTGAFAVVFGGSLLDALVASIMGLVVVLSNYITVKSVSPTARCVFVSFVCGMLTCVLVHFGIGHDEHKIMIGTIMLLIPGLAFGNSLRDMLDGDIIAGIFRLIQSCLTAVMIAIGFGLAIFISGVLL
jgi:uncharacterized membrane protein YjjP (DUF1212 family)